jgi:hypothetical protein
VRPASDAGVAYAAFLMTCATSPGSVLAEQHFERNGRVEVRDDRYHHGHYCVPRGVVVRELPLGYRPYLFHGGRFYFAGGVWYAVRRQSNSRSTATSATVGPGVRPDSIQLGPEEGCRPNRTAPNGTSIDVR